MATRNWNRIDKKEQIDFFFKSPKQVIKNGKENNLGNSTVNKNTRKWSWPAYPEDIV